MADELSCPFCSSDRVRERVAIRYEDYNESYPIYRCRECGREFSEKDLSNINSPH